MDVRYLKQVREVLESSGNDWYRVYLIRAVHRLSGVDCVLSLMDSPSWRWVFPPDLLRLQVPGESGSRARSRFSITSARILFSSSV